MRPGGPYELWLTPEALADLEQLDAKRRAKLFRELPKHHTHPLYNAAPLGHGWKPQIYRRRLGDMRVYFRVRDASQDICFLRVVMRRDAYGEQDRAYSTTTAAQWEEADSPGEGMLRFPSPDADSPQ